MQYFVGDFDGTKFTLDPAHPKPIVSEGGNGYAGSVVDYGKDYYAAIQYNNLPAGTTGPIMVGWLNNWAYANDLPTTPFKGAYSLPRKISLKRTSLGLELIQEPISSIASLRGSKAIQAAVQLTNQRKTLAKSTTNAYELELEITPGNAKTAGVKVAKGTNEETIIQYVDGKLQVDRRRSGNVTFNKHFSGVDEALLSPQNGVIKLRIFVDKSVVEVFANNGERVITNLIFPTESVGGIELFAEGGSAAFKQISLWQVKPTGR